MSRSTVIFGVSIAVHVGLALTVASIRQRERGEIIAISMAESKKKVTDPPKPVEPARATEPEAKRQQPKAEAAKAKVAAAEPKADTPPPPAAPANAAAALDALPDFGLSLSGGVGGSGFAVPVSGPRAAAPTADPQTKTAPRAQAPKPLDECSEPPVKPKPKGVGSPAYTAAAREANVEGKVRIEVTVGPDGSVANARVIAGLGYGLDEAALAAAKRATFEPGTRCGKAVTATFVIAMRFSL